MHFFFLFGFYNSTCFGRSLRPSSGVLQAVDRRFQSGEDLEIGRSQRSTALYPLYLLSMKKDNISLQNSVSLLQYKLSWLNDIWLQNFWYNTVKLKIFWALWQQTFVWYNLFLGFFFNFSWIYFWFFLFPPKKLPFSQHFWTSFIKFPRSIIYISIGDYGHLTLCRGNECSR